MIARGAKPVAGETLSVATGGRFTFATAMTVTLEPASAFAAVKDTG